MLTFDRFEHRSEPLISRCRFFIRIAHGLGVAGVVVGVSLLVGMCGYHWIAGFAWVDALLNASMILGGMGPVSDLPSNAAKIFASMYALYSGLVLIAVTGILLSPIMHRVLHNFHLEGSKHEHG